MNSNIADQKLRDLLEGKLSEAEEKDLEQSIACDPIVRSRWEALTGSAEWPIGSAPQPKQHGSQFLTSVMNGMRSMRSSSTSDLSVNRSKRDELSLDQLNEELAGFRVLREVGRGGMGVVYEGLDETLQRKVAIKLLNPFQSSDEIARERLLGEAQAIASLQHENVLAIYGVQFVSGKPVLIEQFVDGESLQKRIQREGALPINACVSISLQIAKGLAAAHERDIVHRDLKPDNILLDGQSQVARIADFGLAKRGNSSKLTEACFIAGTPSYMSPEQTEGGNVDHRSDLFSLGAMMYVMLTGVVPFDHTDPYVVFDMLRRKKVATAISVRPETPRWLSRLVDQLLAKDPEDRVSSAQEVTQFLATREFRPPSQHRFFRLASYVIGSVLLALVVALACIHGSPFLRLRDSMQDAPKRTQEVPTRGIWIEGRDETYSSLADAFEAAESNATIVLDSDTRACGIQVRGKNLVLVSAPGTQPTIRYAETENRFGYLLRTNANLTLRGIQLDWKTLQAPQLFEEGVPTSVIATDFDTELVIEDCKFLSPQFGVMIGLGGNARISRSTFAGEAMALGCLVSGGRVEVSDCDFRCRCGFVILYPPINVMVPKQTKLFISRSTFSCVSVFDLLLVRRVLVGIHAEIVDSKFDTDCAILLTKSGTRIQDLDSPAIKEWAHRLISWNETRCTHRSTSEYLMGRSTRLPNKMVTCIQSIEEWKSFWQMAPNNTSAVNVPIIEQKPKQ